MPRSSEKLNVVVLLGGVSVERKVSIKSGNAAADALREAGHQVLVVDIVAEDISDVAKLRPDVCFIALHGRFGEDGGVQAMLDHEGIPYTGSNAHASRVAMDKMASKCFFISHDVPTPDFRVVMATQRADGLAVKQAIAEIGLPVVVKPLRQGSSIGVSVARADADVAAGLEAAFEYDDQAIIERLVPGREMTVGVLGHEALPLIELHYGGEIFDYNAKYINAQTEYIVNPRLPEAARERCREAALDAHRALGCTGFSRVDLILDEHEAPTVLEVNTIPGMTARSLFPMAARAAGISFVDLCDRLVRTALDARRPLSVVA